MGDRKPSLVFSERLCRATLFKNKKSERHIDWNIDKILDLFLLSAGQLETLDSIRIKLKAIINISIPCVDYGLYILSF